jgi:hypothetical protein
LNVWTNAVASASATFTNLWASLKVGWTKITGFIELHWETTLKGMRDAWQSSTRFFAGLMVKTQGLVGAATEEEVQDMLSALDDIDAAERARFDKEQKEAPGKVKAEQDAEIAKINAERNAALKQIESLRKQQMAANEAGRTAAEDALEQQLADAQARLAAANQRAADAAAGAERPDRKMGDRKFAGIVASENLGASVQGSFSAAAVRGLGTGTNETNTLLRDIAGSVRVLKSWNGIT